MFNSYCRVPSLCRTLARIPPQTHPPAWLSSSHLLDPALSHATPLPLSCSYCPRWCLLGENKIYSLMLGERTSTGILIWYGCEINKKKKKHNDEHLCYQLWCKAIEKIWFLWLCYTRQQKKDIHSQPLAYMGVGSSNLTKNTKTDAQIPFTVV